MKTLFLSAFITLFISAHAQSQESQRTHAIRVEYVNYFSMFSYQDGSAPNIQAPGVTFGLSTKIGNHWLGSVDLSIMSERKNQSTGYTTVNMRGLRLGVDLYILESYRGFFLGVGTGYDWLSQNQKEGSTTSLDLPESHPMVFFDLGYSMRINERLLCNLKWSLTGQPGAGRRRASSHELRIGLGYKF